MTTGGDGGADGDEFRLEEATSRLAVFGEVDAATAPTLDAALRRAAAEGHAELVIDCRGMTFIDSSGLNVLVANAKRLGAGDVRLVLESPSASAVRLFEISGLAQVLTIRQ